MIILSLFLACIFIVILFTYPSINSLNNFLKILLIILGGPIIWLYVFIRYIEHRGDF